MDSPVEELKMWLVVRKDLDIPKGKLAGQSGHAFEGLTASLFASEELARLYQEYRAHNTPKIVVYCKNLAALDRAESECIAAGIPVYRVTDAGRTVFPEPTQTVMALGPALRTSLPKFVAGFQLMKD